MPHLCSLLGPTFRPHAKQLLPLSASIPSSFNCSSDHSCWGEWIWGPLRRAEELMHWHASPLGRRNAHRRAPVHSDVSVAGLNVFVTPALDMEVGPLGIKCWHQHCLCTNASPDGSGRRQLGLLQ